MNNPSKDKDITIDVFAICYNEEYMLPFFIKHYKALGANITIYDNQSTDRSKEIIEQSGCNYRSYDSDNQIRDDLYLQIKNNCWKASKADWVIVCDIDELLEIPEHIDLSKYSIINTNGYDMLGPPPERMGVYNKMYSKHIMFRPDAINEINYKPGCHGCSPTGNVSGSKETLNLLHYKYISEDYLLERRKLYAGRLSEINKKHGWGSEYQEIEKEKISVIFTAIRSLVKPVSRFANCENAS